MDERFHEFERSVEDWHWWYQVRRDILKVYVERAGRLGGRALHPATSLLLDIGCGTGGSALVLSRYGRVVGIDRERRSFRLAMDRPYAHRVVGAAERLPFRDESFDLVAALDVLEHLDDDVAGAREIRRVLRPGGAAVIFVPALDILWGRNDERSHHRRRYRRASLRRVLTRAGLHALDLGYFNLLLFLPTLLARWAERVVPEAISALEYRTSPSIMNDVLASIFRVELRWLRRHPLPLGTSVCCLAHR